ncbi:MAG: hypothetical protein ACYCST_10755 [Acidimicrobiales bacterium]
MAEVRMPEGVLHAQRADVHFKPSKSYMPGRICDEPSCRTVLSVYNDSTRCASHQRFVDTTRGHRVRRAHRESESRTVAA